MSYDISMAYPQSVHINGEMKHFQQYVNGFMVNPATKQMLLIEKQRPERQKGRWNGVGGKIELGERADTAMCREFMEETGVVTTTTDWEHTLSLEGSDFVVHFYRSFISEFPSFRQTTDESLGLYFLKSIYDTLPVLDNARWIFPIQFAIGVQFPLDVKWIAPRNV